jgi:hypothetical protein
MPSLKGGLSSSSEVLEWITEPVVWDDLSGAVRWVPTASR